jgi:hypothetical protein
MRQFQGVTLREPNSRRPAAHPLEFKLPGRAGHLVGKRGEINANDKKELLQNIAEFFGAMSRGEVRAGASEETEMDRAAASLERRQTLVAAYRDMGGRSFQDIGVAIGMDIYETANRDGFMRHFLMKADVAQGAIPRIRFSFKTQFAVAASSATQIQPLMVRSRFLLPPEFYIEDYLMIEEREINQSSGDILEEKLLEGQEAVMVQEDKLWKKLVDALVGTANQQVNIIGSFTPNALQIMRNQIVANGLTADTLVFASDLWNDFLTGSNFTQFYDPVSQYEIVQTGVIGRIMGLTLISDAYRVPQLKVLNQGEMYMVTRPEYHGAYTDRGPVVAQEINGQANGMGMPARGWYMWEQMSMIIPNARSFVKAVRI